MSIIGKYLLEVPGVRGLLQRASSAYRATVAAELKRYGLRYDDLLNEHEDDVREAIEKLPQQEKELRQKRLKRAIDLDLKSTYLPEHLQEQVDVWNPYLSKRVEELRRKRMERQTYD